MNRACERILGYLPEELLDRNGFDLVHPDDLPYVHSLLAEALSRPDATLPAAYRVRTKTKFWKDWLASCETASPRSNRKTWNSSKPVCMRRHMQSLRSAI